MTNDMTMKKINAINSGNLVPWQRMHDARTKSHFSWHLIWYLTWYLQHNPVLLTQVHIYRTDIQALIPCSKIIPISLTPTVLEIVTTKMFDKCPSSLVAWTWPANSWFLSWKKIWIQTPWSGHHSSMSFFN